MAIYLKDIDFYGFCDYKKNSPVVHHEGESAKVHVKEHEDSVWHLDKKINIFISSLLFLLLTIFINTILLLVTIVIIIYRRKGGGGIGVASQFGAVMVSLEL